MIRLLKILEDKPVKDEYTSSTLSDNSAEYIIEDTTKNNSHDKIFRTILGKENEALYLINKFLKNPLKITDIEKYNSSYITKKLENRECDIVYKLKEKDVYFLIEHQTAVDKNMPTRLLEYMVEIIKSASTSKKHKKDELAVIMPIVLYTGKRKWTVKRYVKDIFPEIQQYKTEINKLELYQLIDINNYTEQELLKSESFITKAMLIQKIKSGEDFKEIVIKIRNTLKNEDEFELFEKILRQILLKNMESKEREKFIEEIMKGGEGSMWNAERVMRNEFRRSRIDGIKQGRLEIIKSMLKENLPIQLISKISNLSEEEIKKLK